jgi:hypothetical protein
MRNRRLLTLRGESGARSSHHPGPDETIVPTGHCMWPNMDRRPPISEPLHSVSAKRVIASRGGLWSATGICPLAASLTRVR